jgi:hypothetical protein
MFATGHIAFDPTGFVLEFQCEAKDCLAHEPPAPTAEEIPRICYGPATELEDALDAFERDEPTGLFLLGGAVNSLVECRFQLEPGWLPRPKDRLKRLQVLDPLAARLAIEATVGGSAGLRVEAARELCRHVTGHEGFFEWESLRENA